MYLEFLILACIIYILASKTALLAKGFREAGQTAANAFRTFADKPEVDYSRKEQKHPITKAVLAPMKAVRKLFVSMELHLTLRLISQIVLRAWEKTCVLFCRLKCDT